jgi:hypothetical protein
VAGVTYKYTFPCTYSITSNLLPKKMEQIVCSETSAIINQTPGNHPKEDILNNKFLEEYDGYFLFCFHLQRLCSYRTYILSLTWAPQLSGDVTADTCVLYDTAAVTCSAIKDALCISADWKIYRMWKWEYVARIRLHGVPWRVSVSMVNHLRFSYKKGDFMISRMAGWLWMTSRGRGKKWW